jgi:translation initiation factor 2B subunit (eIF-2B alpha/beta/delta family)
MTNVNSKSLNVILNNKTSGSSELVEMLNYYLLSANISNFEIPGIIRLVKSKLEHFQVVNKYLGELQSHSKSETSLNKFLKDHSIKQKEKIDKIFNNIYPNLKRIKSIITISRSGTLLGVLKLWRQKDKHFRVVICESRPKLEGKLMAKELANIGIKTLLITDAMMGLYVFQVDAAFIGADVVLNNGNVFNKVGSKSLALFCKEYRKPFYVITTQDKFSNRNTFNPKDENPTELFDKRIKNLSASNIYFEEIEKKFITKIITDRSGN